MEVVKSSLTVFFEDPFWVGIYEVSSNGELRAARIVFGAEPRENELYDWMLQNWSGLRFSLPVTDFERSLGRVSPKRMQRQIGRRITVAGCGTKAQKA